jgi:hypothetical protein
MTVAAAVKYFASHPDLDQLPGSSKRERAARSNRFGKARRLSARLARYRSAGAGSPRPRARVRDVIHRSRTNPWPHCDNALSSALQGHDMPLTLRPAQAFSTLNSSQSDDYDVMEHAKRIGRLFKAERGTEPWCWSLSTAVWKAGLSGRAATRVLALQGLSDAYTAISVLNGSEFQGGLSRLGADGDRARKRTVRSVAQQAEFAPFRQRIGRVDRE